MIKEALIGKSVLLSRPDVLSEANYGRAKRKIEVEMVPFVMISAFRGDSTRTENLRRQKELESAVSKEKFPWTKMVGGYVEEPTEEPEVETEPKMDIPELTEELPVEKPEGTEVRENSILIWEQTRPDKGERTAEDMNLFDLAKFLAKKYKQDSFVYGEPVESERTGDRQMLARLYDKEGNSIKETWAGPWSTLSQINGDDVFWSVIGGKKAKLTEMFELAKTMKVKSREDAMKKQHAFDAVKAALKRLE